MASTPAMAPMMAASATTMAWTWPTVMPCERRMAISRTRSLMPIPSVFTMPSAPMTTAISARTSNRPTSRSSDCARSPARSRAVSGCAASCSAVSRTAPAKTDGATPACGTMTHRDAVVDAEPVARVGGADRGAHRPACAPGSCTRRCRRPRSRSPRLPAGRARSCPPPRSPPARRARRARAPPHHCAGRHRHRHAARRRR